MKWIAAAAYVLWAGYVGVYETRTGNKMVSDRSDFPEDLVSY